MADPEASLEELSANLAEYEQQLEEISRMLLDDPENEEMQAIFENLSEVIQLTRELHQAQAGAEPGELREQHGQLAGPAAAAPAATAATAAGAGGAAAAPPTAASLLPTQMADHILRAQQRAGLTGQGPQAWAVGAKCRAVYSGDGNWYTGVVQGLGSTGGFLVLFDGYGTTEEVAKDSVQLGTADDDTGYQGVAAPKKRHRVGDSTEAAPEMPKWLEIKQGDDEKTRQKKKKLAKAYKSKQRFAKLDQRSKQKADDWKRFLAGGKKKIKK